MTLLDKIKRCVSLVWGFGDVLGGDEIDEFCNENLSNYKEYDELWNYITKISTLENENAILKNENKILKEGKTNVFAELNDETAKSNEILLNEVEDLKQALAEQKQYTAFKCEEHKEIVDKLEKDKTYLDDKLYKQIEATLKLDKENEELKRRIKRMICCGNCKYYQFENDYNIRTCIKDGKTDDKNYRSCQFDLEKWECK